MPHKNIFRGILKRLLLSGFLILSFFSAVVVFADTSTTIPPSASDLILAYKNYVSPTSVSIIPSLLNTFKESISSSSQTASVNQSDILNAFTNYVETRPTTPTIVKVTPPTIQPNSPVTYVTNTYPNTIRGPQGIQGIQGPTGPRGPAGSSGDFDSSQFVSRTFFDKQVEGIFKSIESEGDTTLPAIPALSILIADSTDTYTTITPGAGNSIRINAGGTAWEAYTPGSGGGTVGPGTVNEIAYFDTANTVASLAVATYPSLTELSYVKGLTSAVQTQINAKSPTASPTFTGTVTIPTPFTLGATSVTSTGTQLNYLSAATGTTGTTSTNLVFSTSPTLVTPALGTPTALVLTNATGLPAASVLAGTFGTGAYVMDTSLRVPLLIGSTSTTGDLSLQTTSGVGAAGADMHFLVGNNGATEAMTILNSGNVGVNLTAPLLKLDVAGSQRVTGTASSELTGDINPGDSTLTVPGTSTAFTTELVVGDRINVSGEIRTVTAIASDTSLTIDTTFSTSLATDTTPEKLPAIFIARDSNNVVQMSINDSGLATISTLETGALNFETDAGAVSWVDMSITSAASDNTVESYSAQLDGTPVLTIYGLSDGAGGVDTLRVGIGDTTPDYRLDVETDTASTFASYFFNDGNNANRWGVGIQAGADDNAGTNTMVEWFDGDATSLGSITSSGGTVTYGAFTANHDVSLPEADNKDGYKYGTLVCIDRTYVNPDSPRGVRYDARMCDGTSYDARILGVYAGKYENKPNLHQVYVLGDGQIIVNGENGDIKIGDRIATSSTPGEGMKATQSGVSIATAQEDYHFESSSETKLISVQYGLINNKLSDTLTLEGLDKRVRLLETNGNGSSRGIINTLTQHANDFLNGVLTKVENGIAYMKDIVVDTLKIGSPTKRTGVTFYDEVTGDPYCLSIANGVQKTTAGECVVVEPSTPSTPEPEVIPEPSPEPEPEVTPEPTPEPEVTPEPTPEPEVTPEPTPEPEVTP